MLFGNESISQYTPANLLIWLSMAFQAGLINIGAFLACHRFVSHVTGFATYFGYEVSQHQGGNAFAMLLVPLFFLLGAMLSGQLVDIRLKLHKRPRYYLSFGLIFFLNGLVVLLGWTGYFGPFGETELVTRDYGLLILLSIICGVQNGTVTTVSKSIVRTTHLTGITTDLGIGLVRVLNRGRLRHDAEVEMSANYMRMGIIAFFGLGSVLGGFVFQQFKYLGFVVPTITSGILFGLMFYFQVIRNKSS